MTICRYFQQGTCRYGNRCRFEHVYPNNQAYGSSYSGGGGNFGGYRNGGASYSNNYNANYSYGNSYSNSYGNSYGSGGGGGSSNDRGGTSVLRAKTGTQFPQTSGSIFGQSSASSAYQPNSGFFSSNTPDQKSPVQHEVKEIMLMMINEFAVWERSGQWPLSCFSLFKENGCFPGLVDYSPEEIRWYLYQARASGNLEECQQLIKGIYDNAKVMKERLITPNAEVFELLSRLSRGEKMEEPTTSLPDKLNSSGNFGNTSGGNVTVMPSQAASSFTFTLPSNPEPQTINQSFPGFNTPQANVFSNNFSNSFFNNTPPQNSNPSIFGGANPASQFPQSIHSSPVGVGFPNSAVSTSSVNDSAIYTPMEKVNEEMMNAFNAPVYRMGSVPTKPPPKEICGLRS